MWAKLKKRTLLLELNIQLKVRLSKNFCVLARINSGGAESPEGALTPVAGSLEILPLWDDSLISDPQSPLGVPFYLYNASIAWM